VRWRTTLLAAVTLATMSLVFTVGSAHAQVETPAPSGPSFFPTNPLDWAIDLFNSALAGLGHSLTTDMVGFLDGLLGHTNIINQTPANLSYDNDDVHELWGRVRFVANAALGTVAVFGGINILFRTQIRAPYHGTLEFLPRFLVGVILVNTSLNWGRFAIDLNNMLCGLIGSAPMPAWTSLGQLDVKASLLALFALAVYLLISLLLLGQMLMRLALIDMLLIIAPLALLCWVLPQTQSWAQLWFSTFFSTVFVQFVQVVVLQLGADLAQRTAGGLPFVVANPVPGGREWLMSLMLGVAVLQLARSVPRLMPGHPLGGGGGGGGGAMGSLRAMAIRQMSTPTAAAGSKSSGKKG
jgi:hypothetical protein